MKKNIFLILLVLVSSFGLVAQYQIGHTTITFTDASRSRDVETEIFYPADLAGNDVAVSFGQYPYIVYGHGFTMSYDAYENFVDTLVPMGYILAFPTTEGSMFSPSHEEFGLDLKFLIGALHELGTDTSSLFYSSIGSLNAIIGHSMGGGCSFLAAENNTDITTLINFAAAETDPSSTDAALGVTAPTLVFAGEEDGVAPPSENQLPMYEATGSDCKTYISINGGSHCYFANYNFYCDLASSAGALNRNEQQAVMFNFLLPWLNYYLKNDISEHSVFIDRLTSSSEITYLNDCIQTSLVESDSIEVNVYPNPANDYIFIETNCNMKMKTEIFDMQGKLLVDIENAGKSINISNLLNGIYMLKIFSNGMQVKNQKISVMH